MAFAASVPIRQLPPAPQCRACPEQNPYWMWQCCRCRDIFCWHPLRIDLQGEVSSEHHGHIDNPAAHACVRGAGGGEDAPVSYTSIINPGVSDTHANIVARAESYRSCDVQKARELVEIHSSEGAARDERVVQFLKDKFEELRVPERARTAATLLDMDGVRAQLGQLQADFTAHTARVVAEKTALEQQMAAEKAAHDGSIAVLRSDNALLLCCHELVLLHGSDGLMLQALEADGRLSATTFAAATDHVALLFTLVPQTRGGVLHVALKTFRGKFVRAEDAADDLKLALVDELGDACLLRCEGDLGSARSAVLRTTHNMHVVLHARNGVVNQMPRVADAEPAPNALFRVSAAPGGVPEAAASEMCRAQATAELAELRGMRAVGGGGAAAMAEVDAAVQALEAFLAAPRLDVAALPPLLKSDAFKARMLPEGVPHACVHFHDHAHMCVLAGDAQVKGQEHRQTYFHVRTPIKAKSSIMFHIKIEGYVYSGSHAIDATFCGYMYAAQPKTVYSKVSTLNQGPVATKLEQYVTESDGHLVLKFGPVRRYCFGFSVRYQGHYHNSSQGYGAYSVQARPDPGFKIA
jgi:hypothetical protein